MRCFLIIVVSFLFSVCRSQHPFYYVLNDETGLPTNEIYQVLQDQFGYIWIGCDAGLFRYDGYEYKQYRCDNQNGRSISGLQLDAKGRIWCRNFNGQIYRVEGNVLKLISDIHQSSAGNVFVVDDYCNAWIVQQNQLVCFDENGNRKVSFVLPNAKADNSLVMDLFFYKDIIYYSQTGYGIYTLHTKTKKNKQIKVDGDDLLIKNKSAFYLKNGIVHLLSEEIKGKSYQISKLTNEKIIPLRKFYTQDENNLLYKVNPLNSAETMICSSAGVFSDTVKLSNLDKIKCLLPGKRISYCIKDREGMYWFCTLNDGIFVIPSLNLIKLDPENSPLPNKNVSAIGKADKAIFIGMGNGEVSQLNPKTGLFNNLLIHSTQKLITTKKIQEYNGVTYIAHGQLTSYKKGIYKALPFYNIRDFIIYKDTLYYVNSYVIAKVGMKDLERGDQSKQIVLKTTGGRSVVADTKYNRIYFVLNEGVYYQEKCRWYLLKGNKNQPIYATSLCYKNNQIWIATISSGLLVYENNKKVKGYSIDNGLKENEIKFITTSHQYVWACGNNSLYRIDNRGKIATFNQSNGINATEIKAIEVNDRVVYLGTNKGVLFFPENFGFFSVAPNIEIQSVRQNNKEFPMKDVLHLSYQHKNVQIFLSSVSFKSKSFYYYYRIHGLNNEWIRIPVQNKSIVLSNISPGSFTVEIKSVSETGIESKLIRIPLEVDFPVWQKWWFYVLFFLLGFGVIAVVFYFRIRYIRRKAELHSKLILSQLTALKAQMNPHFMYNALNSIQDLVLEKDIKNSNLYLSKFSKLMRRVLDASGTEKIALQDEIEILQLYLELEKLRFGDEFTFEIEWERTIDPYEIYLPSMIIQPFVENAIKHGLLHKQGEKKLSIHFHSDDYIVCTVRDNGVGRKHAQKIKERRAEKHLSFATKATEKRIELLKEYDQQNYRFEIIDLEENGVPTGTEVIIRMPL